MPKCTNSWLHYICCYRSTVQHYERTTWAIFVLQLCGGVKSTANKQKSSTLKSLMECVQLWRVDYLCTANRHDRKMIFTNGTFVKNEYIQRIKKALKSPIYSPELLLYISVFVLRLHVPKCDLMGLSIVNTDLVSPYKEYLVGPLWHVVQHVNLLKWSSQICSGLVFSVPQFTTTPRFQSWCARERRQMVQTWRQRRYRTYSETPPWGERDDFSLNHSV